MWCLMAAPLMAGNDLEHMSEGTKAILTNKEVIAVDQDEAGIQAKRVRKENGLEVWVKQLSDGSRAVGLLNRGSSEAEITVKWTDLGYPEKLKASVRDLWAHASVGVHAGSYGVKVGSHAVVVVKVVPE